MIELREHPHANGLAPKRQPVCLLLGGGMAAGKSTVREIIGQDIFWSKVRAITVGHLQSGCDANRSAGTYQVNAHMLLSRCTARPLALHRSTESNSTLHMRAS